VTSVEIKAGETAVPSAMSIPGSTLMVISDVSSIYAEINIDEADIARVNLDQAAAIVPVAFPDKSLTGHVVKVAMTPDQEKGQSKRYPVNVKLVPEDGVTFYPGMSCRAEIQTGRISGSNTLSVPVQAVRYSEENDGSNEVSVFVVVNGKAVLRNVTIGLADDTYIEVLSGLSADDEVIVGPPKTLRYLRDGEAVSAVAAAISQLTVISEVAKD
jgi:HlyD family secretion protein